MDVADMSDIAKISSTETQILIYYVYDIVNVKLFTIVWTLQLIIYILCLWFCMLYAKLYTCIPINCLQNMMTKMHLIE